MLIFLSYHTYGYIYIYIYLNLTCYFLPFSKFQEEMNQLAIRVELILPAEIAHNLFKYLLLIILQGKCTQHSIEQSLKVQSLFVCRLKPFFVDSVANPPTF